MPSVGIRTDCTVKKLSIFVELLQTNVLVSLHAYYWLLAVVNSYFHPKNLPSYSDQFSGTVHIHGPLKNTFCQCESKYLLRVLHVGL